MSQSETAVVRSEDELGKKWDRCISDSVVKFGGGFGLGALFSLLFFKRRAWPLVLGSGIGLGMSYSNCQHDFRNPYVARPSRKWPVASASKSANSTSKSVDVVSKPHATPLVDSHPPQFSDEEIKDTSFAANNVGKK